MPLLIQSQRKHTPVRQNAYRRAWSRCEFVARSYGATEAIAKLAAGYAEWPQVKRKVMVSFIIEACNRLLATKIALSNRPALCQIMWPNLFFAGCSLNHFGREKAHPASRCTTPIPTPAHSTQLCTIPKAVPNISLIVRKLNS